jgi:hypothetical protein
MTRYSRHHANDVHSVDPEDTLHAATGSLKRDCRPRLSALEAISDAKNGAAQRVPVIFCHHQHSGQFDLGKSEVVGLRGDPDQAYAAELARRGT